MNFYLGVDGWFLILPPPAPSVHFSGSLLFKYRLHHSENALGLKHFYPLCQLKKRSEKEGKNEEHRMRFFKERNLSNKVYSSFIVLEFTCSIRCHFKVFSIFWKVEI